MVAANDRQAVKFSLPPWNAHDAPEVRKLLGHLGNQTAKVPLLMYRAYEGRENCRQAESLGMKPTVSPLKSRRNPWKYDKDLYKKRNEVERLFRRLKGYRRVFSRSDKQDGISVEFLTFAILYNMSHQPQHTLCKANGWQISGLRFAVVIDGECFLVGKWQKLPFPNPVSKRVWNRNYRNKSLATIVFCGRSSIIFQSKIVLLLRKKSPPKRAATL